MDEPAVTVIGGGVIGTTTALTLELLGHDTVIRTRERADRPRTRRPSFASLWGAGAVHPHAIEMSDMAAAYRDSRAVFRLLADAGTVGVRRHRHLFLHEEPGEGPEEDLLLRPCPVPGEELPAGPDGRQLHGTAATMLFAEMQSYMPRLYQAYEAVGGTIRRQEIAPQDIPELPGRLLANCTGYASRRLFDDPAEFHAVRGHLVRAEGTALPRDDQGRLVSYTLDPVDGEGVYCFPRTDAVIVGGTHQVGQDDGDGWKGETCDGPMTELGGTAVPERIIAENQSLLERFGVDLRSGELTGQIGYRPKREEVRCEITEEQGRRVLHSYGHGGAGITMSWASAIRGTRRAETVLGEPEPATVPDDRPVLDRLSDLVLERVRDR